MALIEKALLGRRNPPPRSNENKYLEMAIYN
jgi:hypothetical protein